MVSKMWFILLIFIPIIMATSAYFLKEITSRSIAVVLSCIMSLVSILYCFFNSHAVIFGFEVEMNKTPIPLMISISLLVASIASSRMMKKNTLLYIVGSLLVVVAFSANQVTFISAWLLSLIIIMYVFELRKINAFILLLVPLCYSIFLSQNFTQSVSGDVYSISFILFPLLASAIYPLSSWFEELNGEDSTFSGIFFTLAIVPMLAIIKFAEAFVLTVNASHLNTIIIIFSVISIFASVFIRSIAYAFSCLILVALAVFFISGLKYVPIVYFLMFTGAVSFLALSISNNSESNIKKWLFMGLPGGMVFVVVLNIIFTYSEVNQFYPACFVISLIIIVLRSLFVKLSDKDVCVDGSRLRLVKLILIIITLIVGIYPEPWLKLFAPNTIVSNTPPSIFIKGRR